MIGANASGAAATVTPRATRVNVPLADLKVQYGQLKGEILAALEEVAESTAYVLGPKVAAFEKDFAAYAGAKHAIEIIAGAGFHN